MIKYVYLAGPMSQGDQIVNVRDAILDAERLRRAGYVVFLPHLSIAYRLVSPLPYEAWMEQDFAWIRRCDALVRRLGPSSGSDREVDFARSLGLPVWFGVDAFLEREPLHVANDGASIVVEDA